MIALFHIIRRNGRGINMRKTIYNSEDLDLAEWRASLNLQLYGSTKNPLWSSIPIGNISDKIIREMILESKNGI